MDTLLVTVALSNMHDSQTLSCKTTMTIRRKPFSLPLSISTQTQTQTQKKVTQMASMPAFLTTVKTIAIIISVSLQ